MAELATLFQQLDEQVVLQDVAVTQVEQGAIQAHEDTTKANEQLTQGIKSARNARKWKWYLLGIVVLILIIIAIVLAVVFGTRNNNKSKSS